MLCVSSALPFVECVVVWALKLPVPHTNVLKPTRRKAFLFIYRKLKRYEHLTLTTNQLVESSFLCFQDNSFYLLKGKELHRNRTPICTESFAGKMVGARVKCSLSVPLDSSNSGEKLCVSWALPFNKRVRVWACKIRKPHTHVFVPTSHKVFYEITGS